jgi:Arc/MetJ family transcription regulator
MKRINIIIDEKLIKAGLKATGLKTHRALVDYALRDLLRRESQRRISELKGKVHWEGNLSSSRKGRQWTRSLGMARSTFTHQALKAAVKEVRISELERKHREGYKRKPVKRGKFEDWEAEQVWVKS